MFNIGMGELFILLFLAFVVVGPKDLPKVARAIARFIKMVNRTMVQMKEAILMEDEIAELDQDLKEVETEVRKANPAKMVEAELKETVKELDTGPV